MKKTLKWAVVATVLAAAVLCCAVAMAASSGTDGNITWTLSDDGVLTISGSGPMNNYGSNGSPWHSNQSSVISVMFGGNVTSISNYAFSNCGSLMSITIPDSITSIGDYAFDYCGSLMSITIPDSVTSIGFGAFWGCSKLTSIIIPDSVTSIGGYAFDYCSSLMSITIPDSVTSIGCGAFWGCSKLTSIIIPDSVTSIGDGTFWGCSNLTSITIPDGVTSIGDSAFYGCSSLTDVYYGGTLNGWKAVSIGAYNEPIQAATTRFHFGDGSSGCMDGNILWFLDDAGVLTISGSGAMKNYSATDDNGSWITTAPWGAGVKCAVITDSVTNIGNYAFDNCSNLTSISIPDSVTSIGHYAFKNCSSLTSITIPDGLTSIGDYTFYGCSSLTSITIPDSVTSIGDGSFEDCSSLTSITIPDSATRIGANAFFGCSRLTSITIPDGVTYIDDGTFAYCGSLTNIAIPDSMTSISAWAFYGCRSLTSITVPDSVTSIGEEAFSRSALKKLWWATESEVSVGEDGIPSGTVIYCYEFTPLEIWATDAGYQVELIDNIQHEDLPILSVPDIIRLDIGTTRQLPVGILPPSPDYAITWTTDDPAIGTVSDEGLFTALSLGTANVTVTVNGKTMTFPVSVVKPAVSLTLPDIWVVAKQTCQAVPVTTPADADLDLTWGTENTTYAIVDEAGLVTGKAVGETDIWVYDNISELYASATVHTCYPVSSVSFAQPAVTVHATRTLQLIADVTMRTQSCQNHLVTFTSSDETVAVVDRNGVVTGIGPGTATITATAVNDSSVFATCTVTVPEPVIFTLPASLTTIESEAFADLPNVDAIRITAHVTTIAPGAFDAGMTLIVPAGSRWVRWAEDNGYGVIEE